MKIKIIILLIICCALGKVKAQQITPFVMNSSGGSFSNNSYSMDWSIGELAIVNTMQSSHGTNYVTNGFLQPQESLTAGNGEKHFTPAEVTILPNPTEGMLRVNVNAHQQGMLSFSIYEVTGKEVLNKQTVSYSGMASQSFDLSHYARGTYYLYILLTSTPDNLTKNGVYKIIKF